MGKQPCREQWVTLWDREVLHTRRRNAIPAPLREAKDISKIKGQKRIKRQQILKTRLSGLSMECCEKVP